MKTCLTENSIRLAYIRDSGDASYQNGMTGRNTEKQ